MADQPRSVDGPEELTTLLTRSTARFCDRYVGLTISLLVGSERATIGVGRAGQHDQPPDGATSFQIGSVTKVVTALLLAEAVHRHEVELDQPVASLIPGVSSHPKGRPITLLDLATHSSGLPRLPPGLRRQALRNRSNPYASFTTEQLIDALGRTPRHPPGRSRYSNFGAGVLGEALVRASGEPFEALVATRIASSLGMTATDLDGGAASMVATGHTRRGKPTVDWQLPALAGAGALRSTPDDLLRFLAAHVTPEATPLAAQIRLAMEPRLRAGRHLRMALGWHVLEVSGENPVWWHNGGTGGFFSFVAVDPAAAVAVVVLANSARSVDRVGSAVLLAARQLLPTT